MLDRAALAITVAGSLLFVAGAIASCAAFGSSPAPVLAEAGAESDANVQAPPDDAAVEEEDAGLDRGPVACGDSACAPGSACIGDQCAELFATASDPVGVAVSGGDVLFIERPGRLMRKGKKDTDRGPGEQMALVNAVSSTKHWEHLSRQQATLIWTQWADSAPVVMNTTLVGDVATPVVSEPGYIEQATGVVRTDDGLTYVSSFVRGAVYVLDGGAAATKVATLGGNVEGLATDGTVVFANWITSGKIVKVVGGSGSDITVGGMPAGLAFSAGKLFFTDQGNGAVGVIARTGGKREDLAALPGSHPIGIAVDATHVYWAANNMILRVHR